MTNNLKLIYIQNLTINQEQCVILEGGLKDTFNMERINSLKF